MNRRDPDTGELVVYHALTGSVRESGELVREPASRAAAACGQPVDLGAPRGIRRRDKGCLTGQVRVRERIRWPPSAPCQSTIR